MMYSGSLFWNEVMPRIRTVLREPGEPLASTVTPDTLPSSRCSTLVVVCFWRLSTSTVPTAPVISDRRCDVYPVTTTSGNTAMARTSADAGACRSWGRPHSCGSSHGREALLGDQVAIRNQHHVPGLHGPGASL